MTTSPDSLPAVDLREVVARALIVETCCEACEPDWESWAPTADAVLAALAPHVVARRAYDALYEKGVASIDEIATAATEVEAERDALRVVVKRLYDGWRPYEGKSWVLCRGPLVPSEPFESELMARILSDLEETP